MVHLHMHHQVQHLDRFGPGSRSSSPVIPPKSIFLDSTTCPIHTAEAHHQVKGIDNRGVGNMGAGGATVPLFCLKFAKIVEKYGFILKIPILCPLTFGLALPLLCKFLTQ